MDFKEFIKESKSLWEIPLTYNLSQIYKQLKTKFKNCDDEVYAFLMEGKDFPNFKSFKETLIEVGQTDFTIEEGLLILYSYKKGGKTNLIDPETKKDLLKIYADEQQIREKIKLEKHNVKNYGTSIIYTPMGNKR